MKLNNHYLFSPALINLARFSLSVLVCGAVFLSLNAAQAATYYISTSDGNDVNCNGTSISPYSSGASQSCPLKTIDKVNTLAIKPGDSILFKSGDTFYGALNVSASGLQGQPITYSSYGSGNKPIITGFTQVTGWVEMGGNIWESANTVSASSSVNIVTIDAANTAMGRTPNLDSYYTIQSHSGNSSISSSQLIGAVDWKGAEVVIRKENWIWQTGQITSQSGSTINYTDAGVFTPKDNFGFFIQDDIRTLDTQNEWYYNPINKKIYVYSVGKPGSVKVASIENVLSIKGRNYITINNLAISGANISDIYLSSANNILISESDISDAGLDGINAVYSSYYTIDNNNINNCNYAGIFTYSHDNYETITNNRLNNNTMIIGVGRLYAPAAIFSDAGHTMISNNTINNSGYNGMMVTSDYGEIRDNVINNSVLNRNDGGGIYIAGANVNLIVDRNIVSNTQGYYNGADSDHDYPIGNGIYLDVNSSYTTVSNNTSFNNSSSGIFLNRGANHNTLRNNLSYDNSTAQIRFSNYSGTAGGVNSNIVENNFFVAKSLSQNAAAFESPYSNDIQNFISSADNNIYARPLSEGQTIYYYQPGLSSGVKTLEQWKAFSGRDQNSQKSPVSVSDANYIFFDYNPGASAKTVSLPYISVDMRGANHSGSLMIPAYSAAILLKDSLKDAMYDSSPPVITSFIIPNTSSSLTISISSLIATDNVGVTRYLINESAVTPSADDPAWSSLIPSTYLFSGSGTKTLYAWAKDASGNISASASRSISIVLVDTVKPVISSFVIPSTSSALNVPITNLTATDNMGVSGYFLSESSLVPAAGFSGWSSSVPTSYIFSSAGTKTLYAWVKDSAGNVSASATDSVVITLNNPVASGNTYYLSPSGSDSSGNGSQTNPWHTLNKAWAVVAPGDTIYLKGGTYQYASSQILRNKNGQEGKMIKIWAAPGEYPVITPAASFSDTRGIQIYGDYIHVKGLEITGFQQKSGANFYYGITAQDSDNNIFEQLVVHDNGFGFSIGNDSGGNLVLNSDFYRNSDPLTYVEGNLPYGGADGLTIRTSDKYKTNTIRGCRMWWNSDDGIDLFNNEGTIIIEDSWAFWNGFKPGTFEAAGDGQGFKIGPTATDQSSSVRRILRRNVAFENRQRGYDQNTANAITQLYNNTAYNNAHIGTGYRSYDFYNYSPINDVKNNLDFLPHNTPLFRDNSILSHNTFLIGGGLNPAYNVTQDDFISLDTSEALRSRQADGSLPDINFLKLKPGSDLIDRGTNVGLPYNGSAPDIGAFESGNVAATPITFTFTGPASGNINAVSGVFTVTPSAPYSGTITITPSGSASAGLPPISLSFSNSASSKTFTITPTVAGIVILTPSNNSGLTNPASLSYAVSAASLPTTDSTPPTISSFTLPSTSTSLMIPIASFTATDNVGVTGYLVTENTGTPPLEASTWRSTPISSYTFSSAGSKTLYAWAKDAAGNISTEVKATTTISLSSNPGGGGGSGSGGKDNIKTNNGGGSGKAKAITVTTEMHEKILSQAQTVVESERALAPESYNNALADSLSGRILLQTENHGEAWYVNPANNLRYYLGTPELAFAVIRSLGIGITNEDLKKIRIANANLSNGPDLDADGLSEAAEEALGTNKNNRDSDSDSYDDKTEIISGYNPLGAGKMPIDAIFSIANAGKIFLQVESHGEAWYLDPVSKMRYYLGTPADAYYLMRTLALGISNADIRMIGVGSIQ